MTGSLLEDTAEMEDSEFGELLAEDLSEDLGGDKEGYRKAAEASIEATAIDSRKTQSTLSRITQLVKRRFMKKFK